ncbi:MAG TPA: AAA family ATPase [Thermoanaerobaculia bacterium]|nr:AAA family ATPase [Thermoanaerobaculia bacterium]
MLTRLKVNGFKNLVDVDIHFGPFTCVAGRNGVGKSNLFDAIRFLSALTEKPLMEAALSVRGEGDRSFDVQTIFHRAGDSQSTQMNFLVEMIIPREGVDHLGQDARAAITFLRYELDLQLRDQTLTIRRESLTHINLSEAREHLAFPHSAAWRRSVVQGRRTVPFISTDSRGSKVYVKLHQDQGKDYRGGGKPRPHVAERLPRTVLSDVNAAENATAVLARQEMRSWRLLQLEPSALRSPDPYTAPTALATNGAHLAATLARLSKVHRSQPLDEEAPEAGAITARIANRLAELIDGVRAVRVDPDDRRELFTLKLTESDGTEHEARSLSDGTLRFLALAILENDPTAQGVLCLEEPENGIHPERIPAMLRLLSDLAVDPKHQASPENPLRQVIVNTHSPAVVAQVQDEDLLVADPVWVTVDSTSGMRPSFRWLKDTWRAKAWPKVPALAPGLVVSYLNPLEPRPTENEDLNNQTESLQKTPRVIDRPDIQMWLPAFHQSQ